MDGCIVLKMTLQYWAHILFKVMGYIIGIFGFKKIIFLAELGDYDPNEHTGNYVSQFKMFLNQTPRLEDKIANEHQKLK